MELTQLSLFKKALVGKQVKHRNEHYREVTLEVENVTVVHGTRQITPDTQANDWYGESVNWTKFYILFIDGSTIEFDTRTTLEIIE